jgi:hypothetical protein
MENVKLINKQLAKIYGIILDGRSNFRLVWSNDETEKRFVIDKWIMLNGIYQPSNGAIEIKKYSHPQYKDRFILEQLKFSPNSEIIGSEFGHYEPMWVFREHDNCNHRFDDLAAIDKCLGQYQVPYWRPVKLVVDSILNPQSTRGLTRENYEARDLEQQDKEVMETYDKLDDGYIGRMASMGEAVFIHRDNDFKES